MLDPISYNSSVVICPYDPNHKIARSRIQGHIIKCERNYPKGFKIVCPFNATHRYSKDEIEKHIETCESKSLIEPEIRYTKEQHEALAKLRKNLNDQVSIMSDESWDRKTIDDSESVAKHSICSNRHKAADSSSATWINVRNSEDLRFPRGSGEAALIELDEDNPTEDAESVFSAMGTGRGRVDHKNVHHSRAIGLGRGKYLAQ